VQQIPARVHARGDVYFGSYRGLYCFGCERFYQERELVDGVCPDHRVAPTEIAEENYFFRMGAYQASRREVREAHADLIVPDGYRREVLALLRDPIGDLCIQRPKSRLAWGIELPFDDRYVTYVWFDALLNYVSALEHRGRLELWPTAHHLIGKDILKAHAVFWPTMLMAAGLPLYRRLCVHGHWQMQAGKMSKSLGNVVRPLAMKARYGMDAFRYYLLRDMAFGQDAEFSEAALVTRLNADLANGLGNLASRVLAMQQRYFAGALQPRAPEPADETLAAAFAAARREVEAHAAELAFHRALEALWRALDQANKYVVETAPFTLAKDPARLPRVGAARGDVLQRAEASGVSTLGCVGATGPAQTNARALALVGRQGPVEIVATVGVHPHHASTADDAAFALLERLARAPGVVAIGETGLDFHYNFSPPAAQRAAFARTVSLARAVGLPLIVHVREAHVEAAELL